MDQQIDEDNLLRNQDPAPPPTTTNLRRQTRAMMKKHYIMRKHKMNFVWEFTVPIFFGWLVRSIADVFNSNYNKENQEEMKMLAHKTIPMLVCIVVPNFSASACRFLIQSLVEDKQSKMRETLRIMSLSRLAYALSYFLMQAGFAVLEALVFSLFMLNQPVIFPQNPVWDSFVFFFIVAMMNLALIPFSMAVSTLFKDAKVASNASLVVVTLPMIIFVQLLRAKSYLMYLFYLIPIFPGLTLLVSLMTPEDQEDLPIDPSYMSYTLAWAILLGSVPLWLMIYFYLDQILPSEYGIRKHPLFFLNKERAAAVADDVDLENTSASDPIQFKGLTKKFGDLAAVKDLSFSIKEGEIMTLLGHNGAGKTTAIYMLSGVLNPTKGDVVVYGNSVIKQTEAVQANLGLCQQFDVLFDLLTVQQHLELTCEIKNVPAGEIQDTITETLRVVMLTEHKHKKVRQLSGGMKRKLSLAMAIVTKPKLIILDEPTSGLDVQSRRQVWELIKYIKHGRSIIMSSQHLEEAEELADRICIMTQGELHTLNTPTQIKKDFGIGFKVLVEPKANGPTAEEFVYLKQQEIDRILLSPENVELGIQENTDSTSKKLIYQVPFSEDRLLTKLLYSLETALGDQVSIDVEINTLEDAYVNIATSGSGDNLQEGRNRGQGASLRTRETSVNDSFVDEHFEEDLKKFGSAKTSATSSSQISAMMKRRLYTFIRSPKEFMLSINSFLYCIINLVLISLFFSSFASNEKDEAEVMQVITTLFFPFALSISLMVSSSLYVLMPVSDREEKLRHLLNFAGMNIYAYNMGLWLSDTIVYVIPVSLLVLFSWVFGIFSLGASSMWLWFTLLIFSYPFIHLNYFVSSLFTKADTAFKYQLYIMLAIYLLPPIFVGFFFLFTGINASFIYVIFPTQTLKDCLVYSLQLAMGLKNDLGIDILKSYMFMIIQGLVLHGLNLLIDKAVINSYREADGLLPVTERTLLEEMQDVKDHRIETIANWNSNENGALLQGKDLSKVFKSTGVAAVKNNSFSVKKGEVFGLLGPNGAGKSTMFNIMTMAMQRSSGEIKLMGEEIDKVNVREMGPKVGLCSQSNTIWGPLTVDQCLNFIAEVKGLSIDDKAFQIEFIKKTLDLDAFSRTRSINLSGGNKRKLVCAISLMACPSVEFLDEPTTGVDPVSRRSLFKMLKSLKDSSLVLSTHRMDEAEQLCDNIAIMINGRFVCYGSPGQLKNRYGLGYTITLTHVMDEPALDSYIGSYMDYLDKSGSKVTTNVDPESNRYKVETTYTIVRHLNSLGGLSFVLGQLCSMKYDSKAISDFTITRSSLEHVFVQFARHQIEDARALN